MHFETRQPRDLILAVFGCGLNALAKPLKSIIIREYARQKRTLHNWGPNGAGKTTFVEQFLPNYAKVNNFINADNIASGLSPLNSSSMDIKAGKLMLELIKSYKERGLSFGFEVTLAGRKWISLIDNFKAQGLLYISFFSTWPR